MKKVIFPYSQKEAKKAGIKFCSDINKSAEFPTRMRELRKLKGERLNKTVSQEEAAKAVGVTRSTIGLYESGENVPDIKAIVKIAEYYETTVNYLLGIDERPKYEDDFIAKKTGLTEEAIKSLTQWHNTPHNMLSAHIHSYTDFLNEIIPQLPLSVGMDYNSLQAERKRGRGSLGFATEEEADAFVEWREKYPSMFIMELHEGKRFLASEIAKAVEDILRKGNDDET